MMITKCPGCGQSAKVPENLVGKRVKCPACGDPFTVTAGAAPPPAKKPAPSAVKPAPKPAIRPAPKPAPPPMGEDDLEVVDTAPKRRGGAPPDDDEGEPRVTGTGLGIQYMRAYKFVFAKPNWFGNLLMATLCNLIPVVGGLVVWGYMFEVVEALHREGDEDYPNFDFGRFGKNLMRGLWPFLLFLIVFVPLIILVQVVNMIVVMVAFSVLKDSAGLITLPFNLLTFLIVFLVALAMVPAFLRVGLSQQLALGETISFVRDFLKRVGLQLVLAQLFLAVMGALVGFVGVLACCVGLIPATILNFLAQHHMMYQLYEVYLDRGGQPVPLKTGE
jgi:hypothetical protein